MFSILPQLVAQGSRKNSLEAVRIDTGREWMIPLDSEGVSIFG
jgi:hypothetical protein